MTFWYWYVGKLNALWPSITVGGKRLAILPGVYKPLENEYACAQFCKPGERVLDLGCGSGVNSVFCAPAAREVVAVDISPAAVENTKENCRVHGLTNVSVARSDMFSAVEGRFDLIVSNPPYFASDFEADENQFATSVRYLPALFAHAAEHLTENGRLLVQFPLWFRGRIERLAVEHGFAVKSVRRMPLKSPGLFLLSMAYLQVGFRSAFYLLEPVPAKRIRIDIVPALDASDAHAEPMIPA
jgi:predicted RNA methylase